MNALMRRKVATKYAIEAQAAADATESTQLDAAWQMVEEAWIAFLVTGTQEAWEVACIRDMMMKRDAGIQVSKEAEKLT